MATTPVFLPGESHGQRSLVGYHPWGCKELNMTERLTLSKPQPRDCFREEGPGVCRMQWPERKQAHTQGCWGCWPALLPLSLWPEDEQSQIPALWCQLSWPCSQAVPEAGHVWAEAQPVDPTPSRFGSQAAWPLAAAGFAQLPHPREQLAIPSSQKERWPEVQNEGGIAEKERAGCWGGILLPSGQELWTEGCPLGELLGCLLPSLPHQEWIISGTPASKKAPAGCSSWNDCFPLFLWPLSGQSFQPQLGQKSSLLRILSWPFPESTGSSPHAPEHPLLNPFSFFHYIFQALMDQKPLSQRFINLGTLISKKKKN